MPGPLQPLHRFLDLRCTATGSASSPCSDIDSRSLRTARASSCRSSSYASRNSSTFVSGTSGAGTGRRWPICSCQERRCRRSGPSGAKAT